MQLDNAFKKIDEYLHLLVSEKDKRKSLDIAIELANKVVSVIYPTDTLHSGEDALDKVISISKFPNQKVESWFKNHPYITDEKTTLEHFNSEKLESKFYWLNETSTKARISAGVMLTPNWEDSELTRFPNYKVGIDFFFANNAKSLLVVLSNQSNLRVFELSERLTNTQKEIFYKILGAGNLSSQELIHKTLWDAFALKEVNKKFFEGIAVLFNELYNFFKTKAGGEKDKEDSKLFANRLIGRLLFIWFLRKKGLVNEGCDYFEAQEDSSIYYENKLKQLFFKTLNTPVSERKTDDKKTPYLNGGLFDAHSNDWINENINFPKGWFVRLYEHFNNFNFTTDESTPEYEQVAVDPEMLGRVLEKLLATMDADTGESVYTPREIVSYMCKESLRQYLYTCLDNKAYNEGVDKLLDESDANFETAHSNAKRDLWGLPSKDVVVAKVIKALDDVRVLDPACGSGAFPMGMLQILLKTYERLDPRFDPYKIKLSILKNNIFGIDIEPMAVEISRLRAWLSLVVDSPDGKKVEPLPNLDFKFVCANSLISLEQCSELFDDSNTEKELFSLRTKVFDEHDQLKKQKLKNDLLNIRDKFLSAELHELSSVRSKQLHSINLADTTQAALCFDPFWHFGLQGEINGGYFDIVIGNPPYVESRSSHVSDKLKKEYQQNVRMHFSEFAQLIPRGTDLLAYFYPTSLRLLSKNGIGALIVQNAWLNTDYGSKLSKFFLNTMKFVQVIDSPFKHFDSDSANINTVITFFKKQSENQCVEFNFMQKNSGQIKTINFNRFDLTDETLKNMKWGVLLYASKIILKSLERVSLKANFKYQNIYKIGQGINEKKNIFIPIDKKHLFQDMDNIIDLVFKEIKYIYSDFDYFAYHVFKKNKHDENVLKSIFAKEFCKARNIKRKFPDIIMPRGIGTYHYAGLLNKKAFSNSFVEIYMMSANEEQKLNIWLFCNSSLFFLYREISGRKNLGGGLLKSEAKDIKQIPLYFPMTDSTTIKRILNNIGEPENIIQRLDTDIQKKIDKIVLSYFDLLEYEEDIKLELIRLFNLRCAKSKT